MTFELMKLNSVIKKTELSKSSIYRGIAEGTFPKQHKIRPRTVRWLKSEVDEWVLGKVANDN